MEMPLVSVIMPIRNEARYIARSFSAVLSQNYPKNCMEIIVVDGMSSDGTKELIYKTMEKFNKNKKEMTEPIIHNSNYLEDAIHLGTNPNIIILDNPDINVTAGLNIGLKQASGEIIILVGGHCEIPKDYIKRCVNLLNTTGVECVGGVLHTIGETTTARAIALSQSSFFGVGGVAFRAGKKEAGYVDTVAFGAYNHKVFQHIGIFDEELVRNQDDEFNFRLLQAGGKIWFDPSLCIKYHSRSSINKLWRQYFEYGLYKVRLIQKRKAIPSWRHLVPALFVIILLTSIFVGSIIRNDIIVLVIAGPYLITSAIASVFVARKDLSVLPIIPVIFFILHFSYGLGFLWGFWKWRKYWLK